LHSLPASIFGIKSFRAGCFYLWASYTFLFVGELDAWWVPYFFGSKPERVARYQAMFGGTNSFLRERHGIIPNTLHVILHSSTVALLAALAVLTL